MCMCVCWSICTTIFLGVEGLHVMSIYECTFAIVQFISSKVPNCIQIFTDFFFERMRCPTLIIPNSRTHSFFLHATHIAKYHKKITKYTWSVQGHRLSTIPGSNSFKLLYTNIFSIKSNIIICFRNFTTAFKIISQRTSAWPQLTNTVFLRWDSMQIEWPP